MKRKNVQLSQSRIEAKNFGRLLRRMHNAGWRSDSSGGLHPIATSFFNEDNGLTADSFSDLLLKQKKFHQEEIDSMDDKMASVLLDNGWQEDAPNVWSKAGWDFNRGYDPNARCYRTLRQAYKIQRRLPV